MKPKLFKVRHLAHSAGFTLIEIMLVVGIITVLMGSAIYMLTGNLEFAKEQRARGDLQAIITQVRMYEMKNGGVPLSESAGLKALVGTGKGFEELPKDPWGQDYKYKIDSASAKGFRVYSMGPDRKDDGGKGDDISSK
jgi:general secretion pathway protein G